MRLKDILNSVKYRVTHEGPDRKKRRKTSALARFLGQSPHGMARRKPKKLVNNHGKHKLRKLAKARRRQKFGGKAP